MKNLYFFIAILFLFHSCGGGEDTTHQEESTTTENADTTAVDSVVSTMIFSEYIEKVNALDPLVENLDTSFAWFESSKANFTQDEKDSACAIYMVMLEKVAYNFGDVEDNSEERYNDMVETYEPYGLNVGGGEGYLWLNTSSNVPAERFKDDISTDYYEYLRLGEITGKQYSADAGMMISYKEWGDVLIELEQRVRDNKQSKYKSAFIGTYIDFLFWYMWGMDNTPITSWGDEPGLNDEVATEYDRMLGMDNGTARIIADHVVFLEDKAYEFTWDDRKRLTEEDVIQYFEL
jgi:hypothetical protein